MVICQNDHIFIFSQSNITDFIGNITKPITNALKTGLDGIYGILNWAKKIFGIGKSEALTAAQNGTITDSQFENNIIEAFAPSMN